jgi:DNA-binding MarR family transcriptional regulator
LLTEPTNSPSGTADTAPVPPRRLPPILRKAWYGLNQAFRRRIAHTGVTPDQFTALRTLIEENPEGLTQRELTALMSSDPNTVASLLERMEAAGWIERRPHETDGRAYRIRILPTGRTQFEACRVIAIALQTEVLQVLEPRERERFLAQLEQVATACRDAADSSPRAQR